MSELVRELEVSLQALKEENAMLRDQLREQNDQLLYVVGGIEEGRHFERLAILAWLREQFDTDSVREAIEGIERVEHHRP